MNRDYVMYIGGVSHLRSVLECTQQQKVNGAINKGDISL